MIFIVQDLIHFSDQFLKWQIIIVRFSPNYSTYKGIHFRSEELNPEKGSKWELEL